MNGGVSVVIPAYNEAAALPTTLNTLRQLPFVHEIVVVDDGSIDQTHRAARGAKTSVLRLRHNGGKGGALEFGVRHASGDIIVLLDADLGRTAAEATALIEPVQRDEADLVIATFAADRRAGFGIVQHVARRGIRRLGGIHVTSPLSGQRALHRRVLTGVAGFASGFGAEVAFTIDAARAGFRVLEVPVAMTHRETGRDVAGFVHRGRQLWHVGRALWSRARRDPRRVRATVQGGE